MKPDTTLPPPPLEAPAASGVKRMNNRPLMIIGGVVVLFLVVLAFVASQRAAQMNQRNAGDKEGNVATQDPRDALQGFDMEAGLIGAKAAAPGPTIKVLSDAEAEAPPAPPALDPFTEELRKRRLDQLQEALAATTGVNRIPLSPQQGEERRNTALAAPDEEPRQRQRRASMDASQGFQQSLNEQLTQLAAASSAIAGSGGDSTINARSDLQRFNGTGDRWFLGNRVDGGKSHQLRAGAVIPGVMISGVNSDLAGQVIAQVSQPVFDTATGRQLLLPQGTRLVGRYESEISYGQRRVFMAWQRLVFPDGRALDIGAMDGADSAGYAGFRDKVSNHYLRIFGSAFLMSGVMAAITHGDNRQGQLEGTTYTEDARRQIALQMGEAARQLLSRNMNIAPTLEIRPGYRFNIMVTKDLDLDATYQTLAR